MFLICNKFVLVSLSLITQMVTNLYNRYIFFIFYNENKLTLLHYYLKFLLTHVQNYRHRHMADYNMWTHK